MRTIVYVDGFNLYYGALKGTPYKWLDLGALCRRLLPRNDIVALKYFTAKVSARPHDPGQPLRQQIYLRALQTLPHLEIIYGHFLSHKVLMPSADDPTRKMWVLKTEEKGSDVNIAAHLINDGHLGRYEAAVLLTNDSDLLQPVMIVRNALNLPVGILNPQRKRPSRVLSKHATFFKAIRPGLLEACQFPEKMQDARGYFRKPTGW
jgi:hypothetical protein